jgi:tetratricopeptide (TPR) repeat protein
MKYPFPPDEYAFEDFCVLVLRTLWSTDQVDRYGRRGQAQTGVDILDFSGGPHLRAAQCKHRKLGSPLTPADIAADVTQALSFSETIHSFYFLTTAERSTDCHLKILQINKMHASSGLFSVTYLPWDSIEVIVDDHPELQERLLTAPAFAAKAVAKTAELVIAALESKLSTATDVTEASIDVELAEARSAIETHQYSLGRLLLNRLRTARWDKCRPHQRFRLLSNLGVAFYYEDRYEDAGRAFIEAAQEDPSNDRATSTKAQGAELIGDYSEARNLAQLSLSRNPLDSKAASILVRHAASDTPWEALLAQIPNTAIDGEVKAAIASHAIEKRLWTDAVSYARQATEQLPDWPVGWLCLGNALFQTELDKLTSASNTTRTIDRDALRRAKEALTRAFDLAAAAERRVTQSDALVLRSKVYDFLDDTKAAARDVEAAYLLDPKKPDVLWARCNLLLQNGDLDGAISSLRQCVAGGGDRVASHVLASLLRRTGIDAFREEAVSLWRELARDSGAKYQEEAALFALRELLAQSDTAKASQFVADLRPLITPAFQEVLLGTLAAADGKDQEADDHALRAAEAIRESESRGTVRSAATFLVERGKYVLALPLFQRLINPGLFSPEMHNYIVVAERLGRFDLVLAACKQLREAGTETAELFEQEIGLLERFDPETAVTILTDRLRTEPAKHLFRVRLLWISARLGRRDVVPFNPTLVPPPDTVDPELALYVVRLLQESNYARAAVEYSYKVLRRHFGSSAAHRAFIHSMSPPTNTEIEPKQKTVSSGSAVRYCEGTAEHWIIVEDDNNPDPPSLPT